MSKRINYPKNRKRKLTFEERMKKAEEETKGFTNVQYKYDEYFEITCPFCGKRFLVDFDELHSRAKREGNKRNKIAGCCSRSCSAKFDTEHRLKQANENAIKKYGSIEAKNAYVFQKSKEGIEKKYGSYSNFMKNVSKKGRETYFKKTGYSHNMRNPACVKKNQERRVKTIKSMPKERKEEWYRKRLETQEKNGTSLFGGRKPITRSHSKKADDFFSNLSKTKFYKNKKLLFGENEKRIKISKNKWFFVDFYDEDDNIVIEFNGNYWHANPNFYNADDKINYPKETLLAKEIWQRDKERLMLIKETLNCKVFIIWEENYDKGDFTLEEVKE